jgi:cytochrome c oxidase subunit 3
MTTRSPFHLVEFSPWPLIGSLRAFIITTGIISWFHQSNPHIITWGLILILLTIVAWWRDVSREATFIGFHTRNVILGLRWGIILFISREILFFVAFFWAFFHSSLIPNHEVGCIWPPTGIEPINPFSIPLLNTAILLGRGVTVTWAHHALIKKNKSRTVTALTTTIILGIYFSVLQASEYITSSFSISDRVYGSIFFVATGFHGLHVIIGTAFLFICLIRCQKNQFSNHHHFGFEARAWYWHFVDVVWIFLYICIYWWGSL